MIDASYQIGVLCVSLFMPSSQSLKEKRMILKSLKEKIRNKFNVSLCEIDGLDKWQVATLGLTVITNDRRVLDSSIQGIFSFIDEFTEVQVCEHTIEYL